MNVVKPCEHCGVDCTTSFVLSWELVGTFYGKDMSPVAEKELKNKRHQLCQDCLELVVKDHIRDNPPPPTIRCIGCDKERRREDMKLLANDHGGAILCPTCIVNMNLPFGGGRS